MENMSYQNPRIAVDKMRYQKLRLKVVNTITQKTRLVMEDQLEQKKVKALLSIIEEGAMTEELMESWLFPEM